jgi:hypothetical protein
MFLEAKYIMFGIEAHLTTDFDGFGGVEEEDVHGLAMDTRSKSWKNGFLRWKIHQIK